MHRVLTNHRIPSFSTKAARAGLAILALPSSTASNSFASPLTFTCSKDSVPTGCGHLLFKFALNFDVRHAIDTKEIVRSTMIGLSRVHAIANDVDTDRLQTFDRFDHFLREIGSFAFRTFGPGRTLVIKLDKDLLHDTRPSNC